MSLNHNQAQGKVQLASPKKPKVDGGTIEVQTDSR